MDLSIIIINYNTSKYSINCIESIVNTISDSINYEIILVDNCSEITDLQNLEEQIKKYNRLKLIKNPTNSGFGGGNTIGAKVAEGQFLAFVNNDTLLINDCFSILIDAMESNPSYGVCSPQSFKENGDFLPTIDHFTSPSKELFGRAFLEFINPKRYPKRKQIYFKPQRGQFVSGSFMIFRKEDFDKIGGFDTKIFLYQEETDICKRLLKINKYAYLIPEAKFIHFHGASTKKSIAIKTELKLSTLYVIKKHYGWWAHKLILFFFIVKYFIRSFFKPEYWNIFKVLIKGGQLNHSLLKK
ncbi:glycosyltransferase family 2 protein [Flavobacterium sp.]|uniref:glycosyltransferase family 2 protein n=1 Tax=Flavobacterium sp. TaxID=239 RepID=UPI0008AD4C12|nr:glycosyltransferase family 2 protein [Flavobacterium sp.]OGS60314.1 MAG: glycosyl transferase family 2 [Flavobacteria bacterium GWF1_32_7]HBD27339.1 glycosyltransferase family 2 protein [Flavobacterium sp.]